MKDKPTLKVLIADDSALLRERLSALIADLDTAELIGQAHDAPGAIAAVQELKPDVVILDIRMPGGNGIQALEAIKAIPAAPVVIMFTSFPYPQYREKCLKAGAEYFFDKSTEFDRIADVFDQLWERSVGDDHPAGGETDPHR